MAQLPHWQPLDGAIPLPEASKPGRVVAVVASEGAVGGGWAASAALDLARSWSGAGEKVILVDGAIHYPTLQDPVEVDNGEGLTDAALFGASVGRVARPVDGGAFFLITAGTAVADANAVAGSRRWGSLLEGFLEAGVRLVLFVRDGDSGCAAFLGAASDIVVLADQNEEAPAAVRDLEGLVRAVTGPGAGAGVASAGSGVRPPEEWTASAPGGRNRLALLALLVVLLIAALLVAFGVIDIPGLSPASAGGAAALLEPVGPVTGSG